MHLTRALWKQRLRRRILSDALAGELQALAGNNQRRCATFVMPSFRVAERWVRDASLPEPVRFVHFCYALESYAWLTGQKWSRTYARLGAQLGFDWEHKPAGAQMTAALDVLRRERERVKLRREEFRQMRRTEKHRGRRQLGKAGQAQWEALFSPDFLEFPHPDLPANVRWN